jgi:hypothetical protein
MCIPGIHMCRWVYMTCMFPAWLKTANIKNIDVM